MTEDTEATLLEWVVQTSYRKGGESISVTEDVVSRETVMNRESFKFCVNSKSDIR